MKFWDTGEETNTETFDYEVMKKKFIENLDYLKTMSVEEQTLYKKWMEWNSDLVSNMKRLPVLQQHYDSLWKPTDIMNKELTISEIQSLDPYVEIVDEDPKEATRWTEIRRLIHTMEFQANPGRNVKCYVKDRTSKKILGQICLGSDITSLGVRDVYIGWQKEDKFTKGKLNCTTIATTIVSTQPFGYNFLGGKLIAALATCPEIRDYWKQKYDNVLVGVGTTSLYGIHSQYNGIPHFKTLGESKGKISTKPDDKVYDPWHQWLKENKSEWYNTHITQERERNGANMGYERNGPVSGIKQKIIQAIYKELGIKSDTYDHGFQRGVYFAQMYENGNEFLCSKIEETDLVLKDKFKQGNDYTMKWWKDKAIKRYEKLYEEGKIKPEVLFYIDAIGLTWEQMKEKYLKEVGR
jgi:Domain of unknown function (DUF4338)